MSRSAFQKAMKAMPAFRNLMHAYVQAFMEQVLVSGACNGAHSVKLRLARWLLMMDDRTDGNILQITQTLLAEMLGVYRPTITNALREFEKSGPSCPRSTTDRGAQSKSSPASVLRMLPTGP
jgi:CRP-like cAMP-binding protein